MLKRLFLVVSVCAPMVVSAQQYDTSGMQAGLSMLEINVDKILDDNGFESVDPQSLDLRTIVEIIAVVEGNDHAGSDRSAIEVALERRRP